MAPFSPGLSQGHLGCKVADIICLEFRSVGRHDLLSCTNKESILMACPSRSEGN